MRRFAAAAGRRLACIARARSVDFEHPYHLIGAVDISAPFWPALGRLVFASADQFTEDVGLTTKHGLADPWLQDWFQLLRDRAGATPILERGCGTGKGRSGLRYRLAYALRCLARH